MKTFDDLGLSETILKAISAEGYTTPTPIQEKAIPALISGRDVLGIAQTGTGKTASFALPLINRIAQDNKTKTQKTCAALILSPTRELAAQITDNLRNYGKFSKIKTVLIVGGVRPSSQIKELKAGVDIIVATPGRLLDHVNSGVLSLKDVHSVVIDEADQMLDLGFLPDIRKIMKKVAVSRQTALFSATMPEQIRKLAKDFLVDPIEVKVASVSKPIERIVQHVRHVAKADKRNVLTQILSSNNVTRTVVFTRTKRGADRVCKHLIASDFKAVSIHGNKSQNQRDRAMKEFRSGNSPILIATDIAARGIDIDEISHVINFDLPNVPESYVHRIGRTARAGRNGEAISLCDASELQLLKDIEMLIGNSLVCDIPEGSTSKVNGTAKPAPTKNKKNPSKSKRKMIGSKTSKNTAKRTKAKRQFKKSGSEKPSDGLMRMLANNGTRNSQSAA